jgi:hypothetical protein
MTTSIDKKLYPYRNSPYDTKTQIEKIGIAYIKSLINGEYDEEMVIYETMKKLQGDELRAWFIEHFIPYIVDDKDYNYDGFFLKNIPFREWLKEMEITRDDIYRIFDCKSLLEILQTLKIKIETIKYDWPIEILIKYWKYYIEEYKFGKYDNDEDYSDSLKDYIICAVHYPGPSI